MPRLRQTPHALSNYLRSAVILLGAVLMGTVALVVAPTQVSWSGVREVLVALAALTAVLTVRLMPVRLPGSSPERSSADVRRPSAAVVAIAAGAGCVAAPLLAGLDAFYFLLAMFSGWLLGLAVKVVIAIQQQ